MIATTDHRHHQIRSARPHNCMPTGLTSSHGLHGTQDCRHASQTLPRPRLQTTTLALTNTSTQHLSQPLNCRHSRSVNASKPYASATRTQQIAIKPSGTELQPRNLQAKQHTKRPQNTTLWRQQHSNTTHTSQLLTPWNVNMETDTTNRHCTSANS